ncbi:hypothetical protein [Haloferula sp. BvORR071]|uniref:hypothetical protein n=1 Tax=Haloferula sp. BvORR071 TaxID=1396141 RepID=UPI000555AD23|nr:hypothetical protein [Haloferula sp. BvORR071]
MDAPELKELLLALRNESQATSSTEPSKRMGEEMMREPLRDAAVGELYHRDAEGSLKWAEALGAEGSILLEQLLRTAAKEEPTFAKTWIDRLRPSKGEQWAKQFCATAWQGSTARSAADMLEVEKLYEGQLGSFSFRPEEIADNFDFRRYLKETASPISLSEIAKFWAARDPDAAFQGVGERATAQDGSGTLFGAILQGMAAMKGDAAAAQWIAGKVDTLPGDRRAEAIGWLLPSGNGTGERVATLMEALRRDQDRIALAKSAIDPFGMNPMSEQVSIQALGYLKVDQQVATLQSAAGNYRQLMASDPRSGQRIQDGFERIMAKLELTEDAKAQVRAGYAPE